MRARRTAVFLLSLVLGVGALACQSAIASSPSSSVGRADVSSKVGAPDAARGEKAYLANCLGCHAPEAKIAPAFASPGFKAKYQSVDALRKVVRTGVHPMPQFPQETLSDQNLNDLVAYIQSLQ